MCIQPLLTSCLPKNPLFFLSLLFFFFLFSLRTSLSSLSVLVHMPPVAPPSYSEIKSIVVKQLKRGKELKKKKEVRQAAPNHTHTLCSGTLLIGYIWKTLTCRNKNNWEGRGYEAPGLLPKNKSDSWSNQKVIRTRKKWPTGQWGLHSGVASREGKGGLESFFFYFFLS